ncbi:MAG: hypothetical protein ABEJ23_04825 [Haloarculaceae archaeon]
MVPFEYPCPGCWTTNNLHEPDCRFGDRPWTAVERAYVDVVAPLSLGPRTEADLREAAEEWSPLAAAALSTLVRRQRVRETDDGRYELRTPAEYRDEVAEPSRDPVKTIYEKGSVPGCHDNAVFALIAWYEMVGLSWPETRDRVIEWLHESGTWARGGFEEETPEELVESKRHVYEAGYGWKEKATAAKHVIDRNR